MFVNVSSMAEPQKLFFISRRTPAYENVYRPEKADSGERSSFTSKLLSRKFVRTELQQTLTHIHKYIYEYIYVIKRFLFLEVYLEVFAVFQKCLHFFHDFSRNP
jgi:hypothetical protein